MVRKNSTVTLKDIAQELGLSVKAVSTGLNGTGRLSPETRKRIQETALRMGYAPNAAARSLVTHRSSFIGVLAPYLNSSFFGNIIAGIEEVAGEQDFTLLLDSLDFDANRQRRVLSRLMQRNVDGIILYPQRHQLELAENLKAIGVPVIQVMNHFTEFGEYAVTVDNLTGGREATEHLIGLGHSRIGFIAHDDESPELVDRHRGYDAAMHGHGLAEERFVRKCFMSIEAGREAALELLTRHPDITAIFAASDVAALGTIQAALELGRRIPEELAIIGFDDLEIAAKQMIYPLSTMAQPKERIGQLAARMMLDIFAGKPVQSQLLNAPLVIRKTTQAAR
ncbi:LacI family DNA-binding transcriptional regulator [Victivallis lenta]|uniref:LacI family DNA-binding transcriptional regulator n=1 Tax=Victivallis lenta TaxID=2606640 RepID=UPI0015AE7C76|nr:LacI family DNA-binding transcriptional regulator [uncultured Victivallis sp.]MBS1451849.1 LacI family DNA-binding transcriptional regulator [Lentisphaeria bacterium]MBS5531593.1 LacI family DNA-binding transcriptional regulator [bacterium]